MHTPYLFQRSRSRRLQSLQGNEVPVDCAVCGFFLGSGIPGGTAYCTRCQGFVITRARTGNLGSVIGALAVVGVGLGLGILAAKILNDIFE